MKRLAVFIALLTMALISINVNAGVQMLDCMRYQGWNQNFGYTTQMKDGCFRCHDQMDDEYYLRFDGISLGVGVSAFECFKIIYMGMGKITGTYGGVRLEAALGIGANAMVAAKIKRPGLITVIGLDFLALGIDPAIVNIEIVNDDNGGDDITRKEE